MASLNRFTIYYTDPDSGHYFEVIYAPNGNGGIVVPEIAETSDAAYWEAFTRLRAKYQEMRSYFQLQYLCETYRFDYNKASNKMLSRMKDLLEKAREEGRPLTNGYIRGFMLWLDGNPIKYEPDPPLNPGGYVYLVKSISGHYKIGRTNNPKYRIGTFEVKLPFEIEAICIIPADDMFDLEHRLHFRFNGRRVRGEWFNLSPEDVEYIKALATEKTA